MRERAVVERRLASMLVTEVARHIGAFSAVATRHGVFYGEIIRLSSALFLIRPRSLPAEPPHSVRADEITSITTLPDPR